jgi:hypothetical protein
MRSLENFIDFNEVWQAGYTFGFRGQANADSPVFVRLDFSSGLGFAKSRHRF